MSDARVPVTLLAGFLGSGKTTLLNRILSGDHGEQVAVIVNEFGAVGIDGRLVKRREEDLIELTNGCVCCTVREDLRTTLLELAARRRRRLFGKRRFDRVVIEASGVASPGPAVQTLLVDGELLESFAVAGVVTLCHAARIEAQLVEHPEASDQVGYADLVILNHLDRVDDAGRAAAEAAVRACNHTAALHGAVRAEIDLRSVLALRPLDEARALPTCGHDHAPDEVCAHVHHTAGVGTLSLTSDAPIDREAFTMWLQFLGKREGVDLMRSKGFLHFARGGAHLVQGVYQWTELTPIDEVLERSTLVLIGRGLDVEEIQRGWRAVQVGLRGAS